MRFPLSTYSILSVAIIGSVGWANQDHLSHLLILQGNPDRIAGTVDAENAALPSDQTPHSGENGRFAATAHAGANDATANAGTTTLPHLTNNENGPVVDNDQADPMGTILVASIADSLAEEPYRFGEERQAVTVTSGDTLMGLLTRASVPRQEAYRAIEAMADTFDPRHLRAGQSIELVFYHEGPHTEFAALAVEPSIDTQVVVARKDDGGYDVEEIQREFDVRPMAAQGTITSSLSHSTASAGVPSPILMELIRAYSYAIDFQRDIQPGDRFEVLFEQEIDENGNVVRSGGVKFASLSVSGQEIPIYRFETAHGIDYFNRAGESIRRLLMRTPIDGARMSSGFGMRQHPIMGYSRMHRGVDFAAPTGTPIYAAGNGVIEYIAWNGGYGNFVRIRHSGGITTAYAHLNEFKSGLSRGDRVSQGDVIGYVGTTGQSTGPHLHYEVAIEGEQVDPMSLDLPTGDVLEGDERREFERYVASVDDMYASLIPDTQVAESFMDN